jgi:hypothetical protein
MSLPRPRPAPRLKPALSAGLLALLLLPALAAQGANGHANFHAVCPGPAHDAAHCHALIVTDERGNPDASTAPSGLSPAQIKSAYGFSTSATAGAGKTIAIVDAYDDPTAESDLAVFSSQFGLPTCTTANGCFTKVNQTGGTGYPSANAGWALEISLDVQWAHAVAPGAHILLVEASSNSFTNLLAAEDYAKTHAQYVSNSWGASEFSGESLYDSHFAQSGVSFFVSAGDAGLPAEYPSAAPKVISVGGTRLTFDSGGNFAGETGWSSGGGGCSAYETATAAQSSFAGYGQAGCGGRRATPDVSLDADPASGVSVYDTTAYGGQTGWFTVGGTSASSPMWAARSAVAGVVVDSAYVYGSSIAFRDITAGNNGAPCLTGFDLCTGRGSWTGAGSNPPPSGTLSLPSGQTLAAGQASAAIHLTLSAAQDTDVAVTLHTDSPGGSFATSSAGPWSAVNGSLTVPAGQTSGDFYDRDTRAGAPTVTASASGFTDAVQTETITPGPLAKLAVSPASAKVNAGGQQTFTASGTDQYSNPVGLGAVTVSWSTSGSIGTLSATTGTTTTLTAGSTAATGTITASAGGATPGSASVTVAACHGKRCR